MPRLPRRMSATDAGFLYLERRHALLHIGAVGVLEGRLEARQLVERVEARLTRLERYGQRAVAVPFLASHPEWEDDRRFDARDHVFEWTLPPSEGDDPLTAAVARLMAQPLDRARPLWEMHVLHGLEGGRTAVLQKVHHCMIDGVSGAQLLEQLLDASDGHEPPVVPLAREREKSAIVRLGRGLGDALDRPFRALRLLGAPARGREAALRLQNAAFAALELATRDVPEMPWNARLGWRRRVSFTRLPLAAVKRIREHRGATINDVVLSLLAGGLHRYLEGMGVETRALELSALVPVSLRRPEESHTLGNRISAMIVPLASDMRSEVPRLAATRAITERLKERRAWTGVDALLDLLDGVPAPLVAIAGRAVRSARVANVVATNVPGPRERRRLCGVELDAFYPLVPIADGLGLGLAVFSYADWLHVGLLADADLVPDLDKLTLGIEESFERLAASA